MSGLRNIWLFERTGKSGAERWREQYCRNGYWVSTLTGDAKAKYDALVALGDDPDPNKVDAIIGNQSWTHETCDVHGTRLDRAVVVSAGDRSLILCPECVYEMADLLAK